MFRFLGKPHINDSAHFRRAVPESIGVISDQGGRPAAIAQAELLDRFDEWRGNSRLERHRRRPVRLGAMGAIACKMRNPFGMVHNFLWISAFTLRYKVYDAACRNSFKFSRRKHDASSRALFRSSP
jgi:hypothetical protein